MYISKVVCIFFPLNSISNKFTSKQKKICVLLRLQVDVVLHVGDYLIND